MFAHQGGWDEALLVLAPIALIFVVLYFAKRKAEALGDAAPGTVSETDGSAEAADGVAGVSDRSARPID